jgi:hypothetical protein
MAGFGNGPHGTSIYAHFAGAFPIEKAVVVMIGEGPFRRLEGEIGNYVSATHRHSLGCDESVIETESTQTRHVSGMPLRPVGSHESIRPVRSHELEIVRKHGSHGQIAHLPQLHHYMVANGIVEALSAVPAVSPLKCGMMFLGAVRFSYWRGHGEYITYYADPP